MELLVGLAIGLFLMTGALSLFSTQSKATLQALLEAQLQRNLRQAMEFMTQDLRRAGAWENALAGVPTQPQSMVLVNPHASLSATSSSIAYGYGQDTARGQTSGLNLVNVDEQFGVRLSNGIIEAAQGQNQWLPLTDGKAVEVTRLTLTPRLQTVLASDTCRKRCCDAISIPACPVINAPNGCPRVERWAFDIQIDGRSRKDPTLTRSLRGEVQVRNEWLVGRCPA